MIQYLKDLKIISHFHNERRDIHSLSAQLTGVYKRTSLAIMVENILTLMILTILETTQWERFAGLSQMG